jgi:hypothetical protein
MMKKSILLLSLLMIFFSVSSSFAYVQDIKTVEGLIENVTGDSIKVRGSYYEITGVPLENAAGKKVQKDQLRVGQKVEIFFQNNKMKTVLIYPEHMVE